MNKKALDYQLNAILSKFGSDDISAESCQVAIEEIESLKENAMANEPMMLSDSTLEVKLPNWVGLLDYISEAVQFFMKNLYPNNRYKKPNVFTKLKFGGYAIILLGKIVLLFAGRK